MCLGIPGRIVRRWSDGDGALLDEAEFLGEHRTIRLNYLPGLQVGDYTIVHAGFALTAMSVEDAAATVAVMREAGLLSASEDEAAVGVPGPGEPGARR